ncbi:Outer membrane protein TolC [Sediminibacterium ginsengisoli]|uniref:Outer membrane protein TolC n=2 Tax=Sediminibacterium ginsengisoli TaxID=413434 RepID=A0A1T4PRP0_9BACT|nr:Outer membrane protein TolC [Sediminibacterium ginsengisoli]
MSSKLLYAVLLIVNPLLSFSQQADTLSRQEATLGNIIKYALQHQPVIQQSLIDEQITETTIRNKLSAWYPQLNFNYSLQHNFEVQTSVIGGNPVRLGVSNTSAAQFTFTQNLFNRDALLAKRSQDDVRTQARQNTGNNKINVTVNVSKAFYDVLATLQQIRVSDENIARLENSLRIATSQYQAGITDKTDYKRATITLNNTKALKASNEAQLKAKTEYLKALIGYPDSAALYIVYDSLQMEREMNLDTLQSADYTQRIEYRLLQTQKRLLEANLRYEKWSYLPSVSANGAYNLNFQNNEFTKLYNTNYPNSFAALTLSFPIFQGGKRKANIEQAQWQLKRTDWDLVNLRANVNAQYAQAIASYKSSFANYRALKENLELAREVYGIIDLQYKSGVKTYLEVMTAESDLRTSQINYYNALYQVLASKIDVQKALGQINY